MNQMKKKKQNQIIRVIDDWGKNELLGKFIELKDSDNVTEIFKNKENTNEKIGFISCARYIGFVHISG